jgi:hypothetical protein
MYEEIMEAINAGASIEDILTLLGETLDTIMEED